MNVSYPRMTSDLLGSQGDMYRTKTGGFHCWELAIAGRLATLKSNALRELYDVAQKAPRGLPYVRWHSVGYNDECLFLAGHRVGCKDVA